jgi:GrpB-like predicted nucleotidyltransferase (UPF0157 family)
VLARNQLLADVSQDRVHAGRLTVRPASAADVRRLGPQGRTHVHLRVGSRWERRHLLFRDYLRANPEAHKAYADVKLAASGVWRGDRMGYNAAKTRVILDITE